MEIPAFAYGTCRDVSAFSKKRARDVLAGASVLSRDEPTIDTGDASGLIVLQRPSGLLAGERHFHVFSVSRELVKLMLAKGMGEAAAEEVRSRVFEESVATPAGVLMLMGQDSYGYFRTSGERQKHYIRACARFWKDMTGLGDRFTMGVSRGGSLWSAAVTLWFCLGQVGFPDGSVAASSSVQVLERQWSRCLGGEVSPDP